VRGGRVRCEFASSGSLSRYLGEGPLEVSYDISVEGVDTGILYIPFVATVLPVTWLAGGEISVRELDAEYLRSVMLIQDMMKKWRPAVSFSTRIIAGKTKTNVFADEGRRGLLYSCGLDSTASFLMNKEHLSTLVMLGGTEDMPLRDKGYWERVQRLASAFAKVNGVSLHFVETNWLKQLNASHLTQDFAASLAAPGRKDDVGYWEEVFRMALLGICAPVTVRERLGTLLMASTFPTETLASLDRVGPVEESLAWGDLAVARDSKSLSRQQKIRTVFAPYCKSNEGQIPLRVCHPIHLEKNRHLRQRGVLNCGECQKCCRTIVGLALDGIDPQGCGFERDTFSADRLRQQLVDRSVRFTGSAFEFWTDIKQHISGRPAQAAEMNPWDCNGFFDWLATYDLSRNIATAAEPLKGGNQ
jgi:hypothetical protein